MQFDERKWLVQDSVDTTHFSVKQRNHFPDTAARDYTRHIFRLHSSRSIPFRRHPHIQLQHFFVGIVKLIPAPHQGMIPALNDCVGAVPGKEGRQRGIPGAETDCLSGVGVGFAPGATGVVGVSSGGEQEDPMSVIKKHSDSSRVLGKYFASDDTVRPRVQQLPGRGNQYPHGHSGVGSVDNVDNKSPLAETNFPRRGEAGGTSSADASVTAENLPLHWRQSQPSEHSSLSSLSTHNYQPQRHQHQQGRMSNDFNPLGAGKKMNTSEDKNDARNSLIEKAMAISEAYREGYTTSDSELGFVPKKLGTRSDSEMETDSSDMTSEPSGDSDSSSYSDSDSDLSRSNTENDVTGGETGTSGTEGFTSGTGYSSQSINVFDHKETADLQMGDVPGYPAAEAFKDGNGSFAGVGSGEGRLPWKKSSFSPQSENKGNRKCGVNEPDDDYDNDGDDDDSRPSEDRRSRRCSKISRHSSTRRKSSLKSSNAPIFSRTDAALDSTDSDFRSQKGKRQPRHESENDKVQGHWQENGKKDRSKEQKEKEEIDASMSSYDKKTDMLRTISPDLMIQSQMSDITLPTCLDDPSVAPSVLSKDGSMDGRSVISKTCTGSVKKMLAVNENAGNIRDKMSEKDADNGAPLVSTSTLSRNKTSSSKGRASQAPSKPSPAVQRRLLSSSATRDCPLTMLQQIGESSRTLQSSQKSRPGLLPPSTRDTAPRHNHLVQVQDDNGESRPESEKTREETPTAAAVPATTASLAASSPAVATDRVTTSGSTPTASLGTESESESESKSSTEIRTPAETVSLRSYRDFPYSVGGSKSSSNRNSGRGKRPMSAKDEGEHDVGYLPSNRAAVKRQSNESHGFCRVGAGQVTELDAKKSNLGLVTKSEIARDNDEIVVGALFMSEENLVSSVEDCYVLGTSRETFTGGVEGGGNEQLKLREQKQQQQLMHHRDVRHLGVAEERHEENRLLAGAVDDADRAPGSEQNRPQQETWQSFDALGVNNTCNGRKDFFSSLNDKSAPNDKSNHGKVTSTGYDVGNYGSSKHKDRSSASGASSSRSSCSRSTSTQEDSTIDGIVSSERSEARSLSGSHCNGSDHKITVDAAIGTRRREEIISRGFEELSSIGSACGYQSVFTGNTEQRERKEHNNQATIIEAANMIQMDFFGNSQGTLGSSSGRDASSSKQETNDCMQVPQQPYRGDVLTTKDACGVRGGRSIPIDGHEMKTVPSVDGPVETISAGWWNQSFDEKRMPTQPASSGAAGWDKQSEGQADVFASQSGIFEGGKNLSSSAAPQADFRKTLQCFSDEDENSVEEVYSDFKDRRISWGRTPSTTDASADKAAGGSAFVARGDGEIKPTSASSGGSVKDRMSGVGPEKQAWSIQPGALESPESDIIGGPEGIIDEGILPPGKVPKNAEQSESPQGSATGTVQDDHEDRGTFHPLTLVSEQDSERKNLKGLDCSEIDLEDITVDPAIAEAEDTIDDNARLVHDALLGLQDHEDVGSNYSGSRSSRRSNAMSSIGSGISHMPKTFTFDKCKRYRWHMVTLLVLLIVMSIMIAVFIPADKSETPSDDHSPSPPDGNTENLFMKKNWAQVGGDITARTLGATVDAKQADPTASQMGFSVALSQNGRRIVVGSRYDSSPSAGLKTGAIRIFEYNNVAGSGRWERIGVIYGEFPGDQFGFSVAISGNGNIVAAGALGSDTNGDRSGQVRVFAYIAQRRSWRQWGQSLYGTNPVDLFGMSVSLSQTGHRMVVGSPYHSDGTMSHTGRIVIFDYEMSDFTWKEMDGSDRTGGANREYLGWSVSLSGDGNHLAVGAPNHAGVGYVKLLRLNNVASQWEHAHYIQGDMLGDDFGYSVSLSHDGSVIAIGVPNGVSSGEDVNVPPGYVAVYNNLDLGYNLVGERIPGTHAGDYSGFSVSISSSGKRVVIGSPQNDANGLNSGKAQVYQYNGQSWDEGIPVYGTESEGDAGLSVSMSPDGLRFAMGVPHRSCTTDDCNDGYAQVYE